MKPQTKKVETSSSILLDETRKGDLLAVRKCLKEDKSNISHAFMIAIEEGHEEIIKYLVCEEKMPLTHFQGTLPHALMVAAGKGLLEAVKWFLKNPAISPEDPAISLKNNNENGLNYFLLAVSAGHLSVVKWLLAEDGGGINFLEANHGYEKTAISLVNEKNYDLMGDFFDKYLAEKLIQSVEKNDYQNLFRWIGYREKLKNHGDNRFRAFYIAIEKDHVECVKELIELKAEVSAINKNGETPLQMAVRKGSWKVANHLSFLDKSPKSNIIERSLIALVKSILLNNFDFIMMLRIPDQKEQAKIIALSQVAIIQLPEEKYDIGFCSEAHGYIQKRLPESFLPDIEVKMKFEENTPLPPDRRDLLAPQIASFILSQNGWAPRTQAISLNELKKSSEMLAGALQSHLIEEKKFSTAEKYRDFLFSNTFSNEFNTTRSWKINNVILFLIGKLFTALSMKTEALRTKEQILGIARDALNSYRSDYPNDLDCQESLSFIEEMLEPIQRKIKQQRQDHAGQEEMLSDSLRYYDHGGKRLPLTNHPDVWFIAVADGNLDAMRAIAYPVDSVVDFLGRSDLMVAIEYKQPQAVEWLLRHGASLRRKNLLGVTPLELAKKIGHLHIFKICVDHANKLEMCKAIESGSIEKMEYFVFHKKVNPNTFDSDFIKVNIKESDFTEKTILFLKLMQTKLLPLVQELHGFIADNDIKSIQKCLISLDDREKRFIVSSSDFLSNSNDSALHSVILKEKWDIFKIFLECNPDLEVRGQTGRTVFLDFIDQGDLERKSECLDILLSKKIDLEARAHDGNTAFHYAIRNGWVLGVERLLRANANPNIRGICNESSAPAENKINNGLSVLESAVFYFEATGDFSILNLLLDKVSIDNINSSNPADNNTAIHYAIMTEHFTIIPLLLNKGALLCNINKAGETSLDILKRYQAAKIGGKQKISIREEKDNILGQLIKRKIDLIESAYENKDLQNKIKKKFLSTPVSQDEFPGVLTIHREGDAQTVEERNPQKLWQYASKNKSPTQVAVIFREIAITLKMIHQLNFVYPTLDSINVFFQLDEKNEVSALKVIAFDKPQPLNGKKMLLAQLELLSPFNSPQFISRYALKGEVLGISEDYYHFALFLYEVLFETHVPTKKQIEDQLKQDAHYEEIDPDYYAIKYTEALFHLMEEQYKKINFSDGGLREAKMGELPKVDSLEAKQPAVSGAPFRSFTYTCIEMPGDGHCFYSAVAMYLSQNQMDRDQKRVTVDQKELRGRVANELLRDPSRSYAAAMLRTPQQTPREALEKYANLVRNTNAWADEFEIKALMDILQRPIIVVRPEQNAEVRVQNPTEEEKRYPGAPIVVKYNNKNHYDAFIQVEDKAVAPPLLSQSSHPSESTSMEHDGQEQVFNDAFDLIKQLVLAKTMMGREKIDLLNHPFLIRGRELSMSDISVSSGHGPLTRVSLNPSHLLVSISRNGGVVTDSSSESNSAVLQV